MDRIAVLKSYLEKTPDDNFLKHALALEYLKLHEENKAIRLFEELLAHDPDYIGSYYHWGKALVKTGDTQKALVIFQKGIEIARKLKDTHAAAELQQAEDDLL